MKRKLSITTGVLVSLLALIMGGCRDRVEPETPDYVEYGWELMADSLYRAAIVQFEAGTELESSYADGWNGLGWAYAREGVADTSAEHFTDGVDLEDTSIVGTEILAGRSFARLALALRKEQFADVVDDAKEALERTPTWEFRRDPAVTYRHLYLTAATAFYGQGKFDSCLVWVQKLDETFPADTTLSGRSQLAAKLEDLRGGL